MIINISKGEMNNTSEVSGLMQVTKERKGLLFTASIFSTLSSLLQIVPFCVRLYKDRNGLNRCLPSQL
ncbi:hypothetical protein ABGV40_17830 [Paenibacillus amylolyticus]